MDKITEIRIEEVKDYDNNEFYYYSIFKDTGLKRNLNQMQASML